MKKITKIICLTIGIVFAFAIVTNAAFQYLFYATLTTYVSTEHGDDYFADTYYGTASVRGADRTLKNNKNAYFVWTRITYKVQGTIYSATAYSGSKYNTNQVVRTVTAYDQWNNGPVTTATYNYYTAYVDGNVGISLEGMDNDYEGGTVVLQ